MKSLFIAAVAIAAAAIASPAGAQLPPGLMGDSPSGPLHSETFYKGPEGHWVLMRNPRNDGSDCSVNFMTRDTVFAIHGPKDADMVKKQLGYLWLEGPNVPKGPAAPTQIRVGLTSLDGPQTIPVTHLDGPRNGFFLVLIRLSDMMKEPHDKNDFTVQYQGRDVYNSKPVRLLEAYRLLDQCMKAAAPPR